MLFLLDRLHCDGTDGRCIGCDGSIPGFPWGLAESNEQNFSPFSSVPSACMMSFSHGSNDAQKSMGIITMALLGAGHISTFRVPFWVMLTCATAMARVRRLVVGGLLLP